MLVGPPVRDGRLEVVAAAHGGVLEGLTGRVELGAHDAVSVLNGCSPNNVAAALALNQGPTSCQPRVSRDAGRGIVLAAGVASIVSRGMVMGSSFAPVLGPYVVQVLVRWSWPPVSGCHTRIKGAVGWLASRSGIAANIRVSSSTPRRRGGGALVLRRWGPDVAVDGDGASGVAERAAHPLIWPAGMTQRRSSGFQRRPGTVLTMATRSASIANWTAAVSPWPAIKTSISASRSAGAAHTRSSDTARLAGSSARASPQHAPQLVQRPHPWGSRGPARRLL